MTLQSGPGYVLAELKRADREQEAVRFLSSAEVLLSPEAVEREVRRFVEDTIQQLEDAGIVKTPLQEEWASIASAGDEVIAFCRTAAALGLDPYDLDDSTNNLVLGLGSGIADSTLLAELAATIDISDLTSAHAWLRDALAEVKVVGDVPALKVPFDPLPLGRWERPWKVGYERAHRVRELLGVPPEQKLDVEALVAVSGIAAGAPHGIVGLTQARGRGTAVVVPRGASDRTRRFAAARAIGRRTFDASRRGLLLTGRDEYAATVERAFAAELLAPARGIERFLGDSASDEALREAADAFGVSFRVIDHQMDNQLGRGSV